MPKWYLYLVRTGDGGLYAGIATDVARRFAEHQALGRRCARYLRGRSPLRLAFKRQIGSRSVALKVERRIKKLPKQRKEQIVRSKPSARELLSRLGIQSEEHGTL